MTRQRRPPPRYMPFRSITADTIRTIIENVSQEGECTVWKKNIRGGYGRIPIGGKLISTHRWFYELIYGELPKNIDVDHLCRNRACIKLYHLDPVPRKENINRGLLGVLRTHCSNGHPWESKNIHIRSDGGSRCLVCRRNYERRSYMRYLKELQSNKNIIHKLKSKNKWIQRKQKSDKKRINTSA